MSAPKHPDDIVPMSPAVGIPEGRESARMDPEEHKARKFRHLHDLLDQAVEFIETVETWKGHPDDREEILHALSKRAPDGHKCDREEER